MNRLTIRTSERLFPSAPNLYGLFFEDINRSADGGLFPEMIRNRAFEDSIPPARVTLCEDRSVFCTPEGFVEEFNNGEGSVRWIRENRTPPTPIPAWYASSAQMTLDREHTMNSSREASLLVKFDRGGSITNTGYSGMFVSEGGEYKLLLFAAADSPVRLTVSLAGSDGACLASAELSICRQEYRRYDVSLRTTRRDTSARLGFTAPEGGTVRFGFTSLKPVDVCPGHGLRRDLVERLRTLRPRFLRFPGGCIVEGFTRETVHRFSHTVGPEWERPSQPLMWHYRATNGLGFHEYLQLCEDLDLEPLYVINCGITCQGRFPEFLGPEDQDNLIQEALNAVEYALGPPNSRWGSMRAAAGHSEPFRLRYIEIGNENFGEVYLPRYRKFRDALKRRYPELICISTCHTELNGLPTEMVDEHFYDTPEFFAENVGLYDNRNRSGPRIFAGELAASVGAPETLHSALGEAMFMIGLERNQDLVRLASYAPLFANARYVAWSPNLIYFDNYRSYTIPSYSVWELFGNHRGDFAVTSEEHSEQLYLPVSGLPAVMGDAGLRYCGAMWNGRPVFSSHELLGSVVTENGVSVTVPGEPKGISPRLADTLRGKVFVTLGDDENAVDGVFQIEMLAEEGRELALGFFCRGSEPSIHWTNHGEPLSAWTLSTVLPFKWIIKDGQSTVLYGRPGHERELVGPSDVSLNIDQFNTFRAELTAREMRLSINGVCVGIVPVPQFPRTASVVTETENTVLVKLVNMPAEETDITVTVDCDLAPDYTHYVLSGKPEWKNSFDEPEKLHIRTLRMSGASRSFVFKAPPSSVNVLELTKANPE